MQTIHSKNTTVETVYNGHRKDSPICTCAHYTQVGYNAISLNGPVRAAVINRWPH